MRCAIKSHVPCQGVRSYVRRSAGALQRYESFIENKEIHNLTVECNSVLVLAGGTIRPLNKNILLYKLLTLPRVLRRPHLWDSWILCWRILRGIRGSLVRIRRSFVTGLRDQVARSSADTVSCKGSKKLCTTHTDGTSYRVKLCHK